MPMPGLMFPIDNSPMQPNQAIKMGLQAMQQARGMQRPTGPQPGQPLDLAAPGMLPNVAPGMLQRLFSQQPQAGAAPGGQQIGMLGRLFPALAQQQQPVMPQGDPTAGLGGLY